MLMLSTSSHHNNTNSNTAVGNATSFLAAVFDPLGSSSGHRSTSSTQRTRLYNSSNHKNHVHGASNTLESNNSSSYCSNSNSKSNNSGDWIDPRIAKAFRSAQSSLTAIVDVLLHEGVATAAIQDLRQQILHADPTTMTTTTTAIADECDLAAVLTRCQDYAAVCTSNGSSSNVGGESRETLSQPLSLSPTLSSSSSSFQLMMACLIRAAWQTVCQYQSLQYRAAYKKFHTARKQQQHPASAATKQQIAAALERQITRAEQVCAAQKGYILATAWEQKLTRIHDSDRTMITMATASSDASVDATAADATSTTTATTKSSSTVVPLTSSWQSSHQVFGDILSTYAVYNVSKRHETAGRKHIVIKAKLLMREGSLMQCPSAEGVKDWHALSDEPSWLVAIFWLFRGPSYRTEQSRALSMVFPNAATRNPSECATCSVAIDDLSRCTNCLFGKAPISSVSWTEQTMPCAHRNLFINSR